MKKRKFSVRNTALFLIVLSLIIFVIFCLNYVINIGQTTNNTEVKYFTVETGNNYYTIAKELKKNNLIKSEFFYKMYVSLHRPNTITAGTYELSESMGVMKIVKRFETGETSKNLNITFREGLNISQIGDIIESKTNISKSEFINTIKDRNYLDTLINKYWFLSSDIKNENIYYPLEGYLYPDTYQIIIDKTSVKEIIEMMLNVMNQKITPYKSQITTGQYTVHQILTMASIVELEAKTSDDRKMVAGVFYNRLNSKYPLGSDVTTYYAEGKKLTESLTKKELASCNNYNTRCSTFKTLPIGPIDNPSIESINSAIVPTVSDNYYFVADITGKVYFSKTSAEQTQVISKLKQEKLWSS